MRSRDARVGDRLETHRFDTGTTGFIEAGGDQGCAVCLRPGTELKFDAPVTAINNLLYGGGDQAEFADVAVFAQHDLDVKHRHHDTMEFADGRKVIVNVMVAGQVATVLQLPAAAVEATKEDESECLTA